MFAVEGKVVLVTGAAGGIGAETVRVFLDAGVKHVIAADLSEKDGKRLEEELNAKYGAKKVKFMKCDVTKDLDNVFDEAIKEFEYIDVVVNNAGLMNDTPDVYLKEIAVNVTAVITSSLKAYHLMRRDKGGRGGTIINISSIVALTQYSTLPVYSATKSAVLQFSNCLGMPINFKRTDVRVLTLCYGCTDTLLLSEVKFGCFDEAIQDIIVEALKKAPKQSVEDAAKGLMQAYQQGASGSTWLITSGRSAEDITGRVRDAYKITSEGID